MQKSWGSEEQGPATASLRRTFPFYLPWCPVHAHSAVIVLWGSSKSSSTINDWYRAQRSHFSHGVQPPLQSKTPTPVVLMFRLQTVSNPPPAPLLLTPCNKQKGCSKKNSKLQPSFSFPQRFTLFANGSGWSWLMYTVLYSLRYFVNHWWQNWDWQVLPLTPGLLWVHVDVILLNTWTGCTNIILATH